MSVFVLEPKRHQYHSKEKKVVILSEIIKRYKDIVLFSSVLLLTVSLLFILISFCAYNLHPNLFQNLLYK